MLKRQLCARFRSCGGAQAAGFAKKVLQDLLGWELDAAKRETCAQSMVALGVNIAFDEERQVWPRSGP